MKILVLNGPNLNMLGIREPEHYGKETYSDLENKIKAHCEGVCEVEIKQTNHEGVLVEYIQNAYFEGVSGIVINPAAYTHTSIAILDAVKSVMIPTIEVHISDVSSREDFRQVSFIRQACIKTISGKGTDGYILAIDDIINYIEGGKV